MKKRQLQLTSEAATKKISAANANASYELLLKAIAEQKKVADSLKNDQNPQIVKLYAEYTAKIEALEAVRESLEGSHVTLRIMGK